MGHAKAMPGTIGAAAACFSLARGGGIGAWGNSYRSFAQRAAGTTHVAVRRAGSIGCRGGWPSAYGTLALDQGIRARGSPTFSELFATRCLSDFGKFWRPSMKML